MISKRIQAIVSGHVHGVGYRYYAAHVASKLELVGTVRNLPSGEVEAVAEGDESALNLFLEALKEGPSAGHVDEVTAAWGEPSGVYKSFQAVA